MRQKFCDAKDRQGQRTVNACKPSKKLYLYSKEYKKLYSLYL